MTVTNKIPNRCCSTSGRRGAGGRGFSALTRIMKSCLFVALELSWSRENQQSIRYNSLCLIYSGRFISFAYFFSFFFFFPPLAGRFCVKSRGDIAQELTTPRSETLLEISALRPEKKFRLIFWRITALNTIDRKFRANVNLRRGIHLFRPTVWRGITGETNRRWNIFIELKITDVYSSYYVSFWDELFSSLRGLRN